MDLVPDALLVALSRSGGYGADFPAGEVGSCRGPSRVARN
jgi:hypothetical protein